jgi:hypothetical protein
LEQVGRVGGEVGGLAVAGDLAYIASGWAIDVVDLSAGGPRLVGRAPLAAEVRDMVAADGFLYIAAAKEGLRILSLSDPLRPVEVGAVPAKSDIRRVAVQGGVAYLLDGIDSHGNDGAGWLRTLDVANPAQPREAGILFLSANLMDLVLAGDQVFLAAADRVDAVITVDVADPSRPRRLGELTWGDCGACLSAIAWDASRLYVVGSGTTGLVVLDASQPAQLRRLGQALPGSGSGTAGYDVVARDGHAQVLCYGLGLCAFDATDPLNPRFVVSKASVYGSHLVAAGQRLVAAGTGAMQVVALADPAAPGPARSLTLLGEVNAPALMPGYLLAGQPNNLVVLDLAAPASPRPLAAAQLSAGGSVWDAHVYQVLADRAFAYVAMGSYFSGAIEVIDLTDPAAPRLRASVEPGGIPGRMALYSGLLYVSQYFEGPPRPGVLALLDVRDPTDVHVAATLPLEGEPYIVGGHLVLVSAAGIRTFALGDPTAPEPRGWLDLPGIDSSLADGPALYVTTRDEDAPKLHVVDLGDPWRPRLAAAIPSHHMLVRAKIANYLLLGGYDGDLNVVDVALPSAPRPVADAYWPPTAGGLTSVAGIATMGDLAYVAGGASGLHVLRLAGVVLPTPSATLTATPAATKLAATPTASATPTSATPRHRPLLLPILRQEKD